MSANADIVTESWAGRLYIPVEIIGETPKRYRCKLLFNARMPGRNILRKAGEVVLVPKRAVKKYENGERNFDHD